MEKIGNHIFGELTLWEKIELSAMMLMTMSVVISWRLGIWALLALCGTAALKSIITRKIGNPALSRMGQASLCLMMAYFAIYAVSVVWSSDRQEGLAEVGKKLPLLIMPLSILISDLRYLKPKHLTAFTFLLAATLTARFLIMLIRALVRFCQGTAITDLLDFNFDPLHHNYLALYLISSIASLYVQLSTHWKETSWKRQRWLALADIVLLILYMVIMGSRSGLVVLVILMAACITHLTFVRKKKGIAIAVVGISLFFIGATYLALPKLYWRIIYSAQQMAEGKRSDSREVLWLSGIEVLNGHEVIGLGCGGYWNQLHERYVAHNFAEGFLHEQYSTHNQYIETALATGLVGLAVMLGMIMLPLIMALKKPQRNLSLLLYTIVYASFLIFEDMFARQMGLLFICWWYGILLVIPTSKQKTLLQT